MPSTDVFWNQFFLYNTAVFPFQFILAAAALILAVSMFFFSSRLLSILLKIDLSLTFLFVGLVFFLIFGGSILAKVFGVIFLIIGLIFLTDLFKNTIYFRISDEKPIRYLTVFWLLSIFLLYPGLSLLLGHNYPKICFPIATPCPLTIFAITMLVSSMPNVSKFQLIMLLPWALMALPKMFGMYGCYEDGLLFLSGLYGLYFLIRKWNQLPNISFKR